MKQRPKLAKFSYLPRAWKEEEEWRPFVDYFKWDCFGILISIFDDSFRIESTRKGGLLWGFVRGEEDHILIDQFLLTEYALWNGYDNPELHFQLSFLIISSATKYFQCFRDYLELICPSSLSGCWDINLPFLDNWGFHLFK